VAGDDIISSMKEIRGHLEVGVGIKVCLTKEREKKEKGILTKVQQLIAFYCVLVCKLSCGMHRSVAVFLMLLEVELERCCWIWSGSVLFFLLCGVGLFTFKHHISAGCFPVWNYMEVDLLVLFVSFQFS